MKWNIGLLLLMIHLGARAQQPAFNAAIDTNRILIGEQIFVTLSATELPANQLPAWPNWPDSLAEVEVLNVTWDTAKSATGNLNITAKYLITSFDSGFVVIPPFAIETNGEWLQTEPLILNINTVEENPEIELYDVKQPEKAPIDWWYWIKKYAWIIWISALILAAILWFILTRKKKKRTVPAVVDTRTPAQRAHQALLALRDERLWQSGEVKEYYSKLTDIARTYLEEQENIAALEMTSDELMDAAQTRMPAAAQKLLGQLLRNADMVKFAKGNPLPEDHIQAWDDALAWLTLVEPQKPTAP